MMRYDLTNTTSDESGLATSWLTGAEDVHFEDVEKSCSGMDFRRERETRNLETRNVDSGNLKVL